MKTTTISILVSALLAGCAAHSPIETRADSQLREALADAAKQRERRAAVIQTLDKIPSARGTEVEVDDDRNTVSMSASNANFFALIQSLAKRAGLSGAAALDGVNTAQRINIEIEGMTPEQAIHHVAFLAGYAAAINKNDRTVTVAETASYTFRIPPNLLQKLGSSFTVGGNPVSGGSSGSSGSSAGQSSGGSGGAAQAAPIKAEFTITGRTDTSPSNFTAYLKQLAGKNAEVQVYPENGLINVRGNGQALKRVSDFLQHYVNDAMRQVEVSATVAEVQLNDDFRYGIKWSKIFNAAGGKRIAVDTTSAFGTASPLISLNYTTASITSLLEALDKNTSVRVVSQPSGLAMNHTPTTLADVNQIPYLPNVQTTVTGTAGTTQTSASTAYAVDGVSLSFTADILSNNLVQLNIIPVTTSVGNMVSFLGGQIQVPQQGTKQSDMQVLIENGQTVILGGNRHAKGDNDNEGIPGVKRIPGIGDLLSGKSRQDEVREHVILLRVQILPPPRYNPLVAEAI